MVLYLHMTTQREAGAGVLYALERRASPAKRMIAMSIYQRSHYFPLKLLCALLAQAIERALPAVPEPNRFRSSGS